MARKRVEEGGQGKPETFDLLKQDKGHEGVDKRPSECTVEIVLSL